jgi:uncharacterized protein YndB with AHSA1/START domain
MTAKTQTGLTTQVYQIYIKASPQAIWDAITEPEWTVKYMYESRVEYELGPGGTYRGIASESMRRHGAEMGYEIPDVVADGEVIEADPPHKLVQTWRMLMDPRMAAEGFTRLTWEINEIQQGVSKLTVVHDLDGAQQTAVMVAGGMEAEGAGGGWNEILSSLKTLLETGEVLRG